MLMKPFLKRSQPWGRFWLSAIVSLMVGLSTTYATVPTNAIDRIVQGNCPPSETEVIIWPTLQTLSSMAPHAGDTITVQGSGGFIRCSSGLYNESARSFGLTLDAEPLGQLGCYANHCQATLTIPLTTSSGIHTIATEGGSQISITVQPQRVMQVVMFLPAIVHEGEH